MLTAHLAHREAGDSDRMVAELRKSAESESGKGRHLVSAQLWETVASVLCAHEDAGHPCAIIDGTVKNFISLGIGIYP